MKFPITKIAAWLAAGSALALSACGGSSNTPPEPVTVKVIAMNDFHGNIETPAANNGGSVVLKDPANAAGTTVRTGGAAYLATLIKQLKARNANNIVVGAGDMVGASPVTSTLTHDEATIDILNQIGLEVTSVGNHEFDHGKNELLRQQNGGCYVGGTVGKDTCINGGVFGGAEARARHRRPSALRSARRGGGGDDPRCDATLPRPARRRGAGTARRSPPLSRARPVSG